MTEGNTAAKGADAVLEAERNVVGCLLLGGDLCHDMFILLREGMFYNDVPRMLFSEIRELYDANMAIGVVTLLERLRLRGRFEGVDGEDALKEIVKGVPVGANCVEYARIVRRYAESRDDVILRLGDALRTVMQETAIRAESGGRRVTGLASGFHGLDDITLGFQPGQLSIVASRPGMGKTAIALDICAHVGSNLRIPTLFVSTESGHIEIAERFLCARSGIDGERVRSGVGHGSRSLRTLSDAYKELAAARIYIDDAPRNDIARVTEMARIAHRRYGIGLLIIDSIQMVRSERSDEGRPQEVGRIVRELKAVARELLIPVIALSQVDRRCEQRENKRPYLCDMSESAAIEAIADLVIFLVRPEYYDGRDRPGHAELIVAKNRNGPTGDVGLIVLKNLASFRGVARDKLAPFDEGSPF